jgi:enterobactin synthetase component D
MAFAPALRDLPACVFEETTFSIDTLTLRKLEHVYPLPNALRRAVLKRQVEFLAGRVCAQRAIRRLTGRTHAIIPLQSDRSPVWPADVVGAITHTAGYAAVLVAPSTMYHGIGIDCACVLSPDKLPLHKYICIPNELEGLLARYSTWSPAELLTLIFSAKESLYKCLYPQVRIFFAFHAAHVTAIDIERHTFTIQLEKDVHANMPAASQWMGSFVYQHSLLMTVIVSQEARNIDQTQQ